jgi:hypothetical protein
MNDEKEELGGGRYIANMRLHPDRQTVTKNPDGSITVHIPITFKMYGGKKYIITPPHPLDDAPSGTVYTKGITPKPRTAILKALAQAFEWKEMIDRGEVQSSTELAKKLKMTDSYIGRILRLSLLAPDIIEALLDGKQPEKLSLRDLLKPVPQDWNEQRMKYGFAVTSA